MSTLSDKIKAAEAELVTTKDSLTDAVKQLEEMPDSEEFVALVEELSGKIEKQTASVAALKKAEQALAKNAQPLEGITGGGAPAHISRRSKSTSVDLLFKSAVIALESGIRHVSPQQVMEERYSGNEELKAVMPLVTKAAQAPAMTTVPAWAGELVEQAYGEFMDLLKPVSIVPKLSLRQFQFDGYGSIKIPMRNAAATPNLAGAFRAEGAAIRVGAAQIGSMTLTPKSLGVIGTYTDEILRRSTPQIENLIRQFILDDTAAVLDSVFVGNSAPSATSPGGITNGIAAANTAASLGATVANIQNDLKARLAQMASLNMGSRPVWIMHPLRQVSLSMQLTATGQAAFPSVASGTLFGAPIITSTTASQSEVLLIDQNEIAFAGGVPQFDYSSQAVLHEDDSAATVASDLNGQTPVRSLWQTNSHAIRVLWDIDWAILRPGCVQQITAVAW